MYNMLDEKLPKPPVISSQAGALNQMESWLKENRYDRVKDADGMTWDVDVRATSIPHPKDPKIEQLHPMFHQQLGQTESGPPMLRPTRSLNGYV